MKWSWMDLTLFFLSKHTNIIFTILKRLLKYEEILDSLALHHIYSMCAWGGPALQNLMTWISTFAFFAPLPFCTCSLNTHTGICTVCPFDVNHSDSVIYKPHPCPFNCIPSVAPLHLRDDRAKCEGTSLEIALDIKAKPFSLDYDFSKKKKKKDLVVLQRTP